VSDNDPDASAEEVVASCNDKRVRYFHNSGNLGMIKSFNKSIDRAETDYIVMVTDDDPIEHQFLADFYELYKKYPGYSIYCGFLRSATKPREVEIIDKNDFIQEILDPDRTYSLLWSSSVMRRSDAIEIGRIPDYGSPHLADHALIVMTGSKSGGVVLNKMYSSLTLHDNNFSKANFDAYAKGCEGFYKTLDAFCKANRHYSKSRQAVIKHLGKWFISAVLSLKKYYTRRKYDPTMLKEVNEFADTILNLSFMKRWRLRYQVKTILFHIKRTVGILR
jgi:glycosyltransferase involved in cell wall biosynthesis